MLGALLAATGAVVAVGAPARSRLARLDETRQSRRPQRTVPTGALAAVGAVLVVGLVAGVRAGLWAATAAVVAATVLTLVRGHRRRARERGAAVECARAARVLAGLLRSGQIQTEALQEAASECRVLASAAAAGHLGADVAAELEAASFRPGQAGLRLVAAAWRISERSGAPVADVLGRVAENLRQRQALGAIVETELAAARTSGQIMAALPFLAMGLGFAVGINPLDFLLGSILGQVLFLAGVALTAVGVLWIDRLAAPRSAP